MIELVRDLRYGVRMLLRHPTVTVISLLTLGLGIGASTAVFSVVDSTLLSPPPLEEPDRLVQLFASKPAAGWSRMTISTPNFKDWRDQNSSLETAGIFGRQAVNVMGQVALALMISAGLMIRSLMTLKAVDPASTPTTCSRCGSHCRTKDIPPAPSEAPSSSAVFVRFPPFPACEPPESILSLLFVASDMSGVS